MAKKHRKLFPLLAETDKTLDCSSGACDEGCPDNCYSHPYYYTYISPQLPPLSAPSPSILAIYEQSQSSPISFDSVIIIVASAFLAILVTGFILAAKFASNRVNRVNHERDNGDSEDFTDGEQVDHPIWFIRTPGLQQSVINSITICRYKRGEGLIERTDCPICLNEFEEDESLRLLPKCNHAFHISCIDTWLRSHTNCPLCRASVVSSRVASRSSAQDDASSGGSGTQTENDGDGDGGEGRDAHQNEIRAEPGRRDMDETALKAPMSSGYGNSLNLDRNSKAQIESSRLSDEYDENSQERTSDESENRNEPEREDTFRVFRESLGPNLGSSINGVSCTITQRENSDLQGKSCQNQNQEPIRISLSENRTEEETETENKTIEEEASCSNENSLNEVQCRRMSDSIDSGESNSAAKSQTGISSKQIGSSRFSRNTSWVFPL